MNLLQLFLQYLPQLMQGASSIQDIFDYIKKVRQAAQQTGEWTPEYEAAFTASLEELKNNPPPWGVPDPE